MMIVITSISSKAQLFYENNFHFNIFNKGYSVAEVVKHNELTSIYKIDNSTHTIRVYDVSFFYDLEFKGGKYLVTGEDTTFFFDTEKYYRLGTKYYSLELKSEYFFDGFSEKLETVKHYYGESTIVSILDGTSQTQTESLIVNYENYSFDSKNLVISKNYIKVINGIITSERKVYFGYNQEKNLILELESEGRDQWTFIYENDNQTIYSKSINGYYEVKYELNEYGAVNVKHYETNKTFYTYNSQGILVKENHIGKYKGQSTVINYK